MPFNARWLLVCGFLLSLRADLLHRHVGGNAQERGGSSYFNDTQWTNHPSQFCRLRSPWGSPWSADMRGPRRGQDGADPNRAPVGSVTNASARPSRQGDYFLPRIASFAALATRNFTTRLAAILMVAPVAGLRPMRALRFTRTSLPRPGRVKEFFAFL